MRRNSCRKCGRRLPKPRQGAGRPREYCSTGCRRSREYQLRRLQKQLEAAEGQEQHWRRAMNGLDFYGQLDYAQAECQWWMREVELLEERLRELLDDEKDSPPVKKAG